MKCYDTNKDLYVKESTFITFEYYKKNTNKDIRYFIQLQTKYFDSANIFT